MVTLFEYSANAVWSSCSCVLSPGATNCAISAYKKYKTSLSGSLIRTRFPKRNLDDELSVITRKRCNIYKRNVWYSSSVMVTLEPETEGILLEISDGPLEPGCTVRLT